VLVAVRIFPVTLGIGLKVVLSNVRGARNVELIYKEKVGEGNSGEVSDLSVIACLICL